MSEDQTGATTPSSQNDAPQPSSQVEEPTLRARISTWLSKRPLSSVIVAAVLALLLGIGIGGIAAKGKDEFRHHRMEQRWDDRDGRGPGMRGPNGFGGPQGGLGNPNDQRGPGMMPGGPGLDGPPPGQPSPIASPSETAQ